MAEASNKLSGQGLILGSQTTAEIAAHDQSGTSKVLLYASGSGAASKLYMKTGGNVQKPVGTDVESLPAFTGSLVEGDLFMVADQDKAEGNEAKITFGTISGSVYSNISGDITVATSGVSAIGDLKVTNAMLAGSIVNTKLVNDSVTVTAGDGLKGGGEVDLGASVTLNIDVSDFAGTGLEEDGSTENLKVSAAQTTITSIINSGMTKIGTALDEEYIKFDTANQINLHIQDTERLSVTATGAEVTGDLTVSGDLTVNGDLVQQNVSQLVVEDTLIGLGYGASATGSVGDRGLVMGLDGENAAAIIWDESHSQFALGRTSTDNKATAATFTSYAPVRMGSTITEQIGPNGDSNLLTLSSNVLTVAGAVNATTLSGSSTLNLDGAAQFNGNVTVKAGATVDLTGATLTLDNDELSGDKIEGGTINAITINTLTATAVNSATLSGSSTLNLDGAAQFNGAVTVKNGQTLTSNAVDINGGAIDGAVIGANDAAAGTFTTLTANDQLVVAAGATITGDTTNEITLAVKGVGSQTANLLTVEQSDGTDKLTVSAAGVTTAASLVATTADINGGTVDAVIGGTTPAAGTFTTVAGATGSFNAGAEAVALSVVGGGTFKGIGATATGPVGFFANGDDSNAMAAFISGSSAVNGDALHLRRNATKLMFSDLDGSDAEAAIGYFNTGTTLQLSGSKNITLITGGGDKIELGRPGHLTDVVFYGENSSEIGAGADYVKWDADDNDFKFYNADTVYMKIGQDTNSADGDYAICVGTLGGGLQTDNKHAIIAGGYETHSDRELKTDIAPMTDALDRVMKLEPVTYEMKNRPGQSDFGFIAQDVAKVAPEICGIDKDGIGRSIDYSRMSTLLAGAVKAQQLQIDELKTIISKLQK